MMSRPPKLPEPVAAEYESTLGRKYGKEVTNYFSGSPLNRVSFLRGDHKFLSAAVKHPSTSFLLFRNLSPLSHDSTRLCHVSYKDVQPLIGDDPFVQPDEELIASYDSTVTVPNLVFLGLNEQNKSGFVWSLYHGSPYFALDVTCKGSLSEAAMKLIQQYEDQGLYFLEGRTHMTLPASEAAIYAQARALLDWNARNPFCAACGHSTLSVNGGTKRVCPPRDMASSKGGASCNGSSPPIERPPCNTRTGISNLSFPRTDPTVIMAVLSVDSQRTLVGRQKRWPPHWYSTLAGFVEPAESVEEAVRREVWEESGVKLGRVIIHSTQAWPYPANLMIGAIAQAIPGGEDIHLKHDPELEDAKWVSISEIKEALVVGTSGLGDPPSKEYREGGLRLPPRTAIANQLLEAVVQGSLDADVEIYEQSNSLI